MTIKPSVAVIAIHCLNIFTQEKYYNYNRLLDILLNFATKDYDDETND